MEQIFRVVLSLSISGSMVGLLILLFRPAARRFFAKRWMYYLWLLALARLLVPISADVNLMAYLFAGQTAAESLQSSEASAMRQETDDKQGMAVSGVTAEEKAKPIPDAVGETKTEAIVKRANVFRIFGMLWLLGVFLTAAYKVYTYRNFVRGIYAGRKPVTDQRILDKSVEIQIRLGMIKRVPLYETEAVNSPMLVGLREPCIYLPPEVLAQMAGNKNEILLILHHELVHLRRRDIWYKWLFQAALCMHWFNPLVYLFHRKFNIDCELACDEVVMAFLSEEGRRAYGKVLLDVAEKNLSGEAFRIHGNVPTMTLLEEKGMLKERLRNIAEYHKKGFLIGLCSAVVLVMFAAVALVCGAAVVRADSEEHMMNRSSSGFLDDILESIENIYASSGNFFDEVMVVNEQETPYLMYDDDELIASESESDVWRAWIYTGGDRSVDVKKFVLNGSDILWIVYANKETTLELKSSFALHDGRFKIVQVMPDQTVRVLNESGEEISGEITLPAGRNCFKMVGQKARLESLRVAYRGEDKKDIDGIYSSESEEYAYRVQAGEEPLDMSKLEEVSVYLNGEQVSGLYRCAWESGLTFSDENWKNLYVFSDEELTSRYLLEALQAGKIEDFDSRTLSMFDYMMDEKTVSECFRWLLERGKVSASDWENIFFYSDSDLSATYLTEALKKGEASGFNGTFLGQIGFRISSEELTELVLALGKEELTLENLRNLFPYLEEGQITQCIFHYIDLGNILTDAELQDMEIYVSEDNFYRLIEYNGKRK